MSTSTLPRPERPPPPPDAERRIIALMSFEALTLAIFSTLHLSGALHVGSSNSNGAGIAEAVICVVLLIGIGALARVPAAGPRAALLSTGFAILGFIVGLTFTLRGGDAIDITYHAVMLPVLIATAAVLARADRVRR
jgi:hypothetical protein